MKAGLRYIVILFGAVCVFIGLTHVVFGPSSIPGSVPVNATMDSEDRFYATLFIGYGGALIWCALNLVDRRRPFFWLLILFFASGVSRLISMALVGQPFWLFQYLTGVELLLPPLLWYWHKQIFDEQGPSI
jgi:hypothetical protein